MDILESDIVFLKRAVDLAYQAEALDNLPIGAVIVLGGRIIAEGQNAIWFPSFNQNRHAEIEALRAVPKNLWDASAEMTLYTTLEPCMMCAGAIKLARLQRLVFGAFDPQAGVFGSIMDVGRDTHRDLAVTPGVLAGDCGALLQSFFQQARSRKKNT